MTKQEVINGLKHAADDDECCRLVIEEAIRILNDEHLRALTEG